MSYLKLSQQVGVTLIELMVALTLGAMLTLGIVEIYGAARRTNEFNMQLARLQEDHRFLTAYLDSNLRLAGWRSNPMDDKNMVFAPITIARTLDGNQVNVAMRTGQVIAGAVINGQDAIIVRRQANTDPMNEVMMNCLGFEDKPGVSQIINIFFIAQTQQGIELSCFSDDLVTPNLRSQPLVSNVTGMAVLYGVALPGVGFQYFDIAAMNQNPGMWLQIVSVQLQLLMQSTREIATAPQPYAFPIGAAPTTPQDRFLRRVVTTIIRIRN